MKENKEWDWHPGEKQTPVKEWQDRFNWVEEPHVSPDGEKIAAIVNIEEGQFSVCVNGETWEETFDKAWCLRFLPDGRLCALVSADEEWTVCVDNSLWETRFDYIWDFQYTEDGGVIGAAVQQDGRYGMAVNDDVWPSLYENISGVILGNRGNSAAIVQVAPLSQGDIETFRQGIFSVAVNGIAQPEKYMNAWDLSFDGSGRQIAYTVRKNRENYSISKDGQSWQENFQSAWKPEFIHKDTSVIAPVRQNGRWFLFKDGSAFWKKGYDQLWKLAIHGDGEKIGAVVSTTYGKWTVSENDIPWNFDCDAMISELFYSQTGDCLVAVFKNKGHWDVAVNGHPWHLKADKLWKPVVSDDGQVMATRMEKEGRFYLAVNGTPYKESFDWVFEPKISPDKTKILLKTMKNRIYSRQVLTLDQIF